jgi:H+-transporting ATPase
VVVPPTAVDNEAVREGAGIAEPAGLSASEARLRLQVYGPNAVAEARPRFWRRAAGKLWAPVPWMLEITIAAELALGRRGEAALIAGLLLINAAMALIEEGRAQAALQTLRQKLVVQARVKRDGHWQVVPAAELVPGDAIHLRAGDLVPADVRLLDGALLVDQSLLTGEALPADLAAGAPAYAGALVRRGEATAEVAATGTRTFFGRTAELLRAAGAPSRLEGVILAVVRYLVGLDAVLLIASLAFSLWRGGFGLGELIEFALVLMLASVPVALPMAFTLGSTLGALELSREGVLATRLTAIEEAAGMDVLCSDKTGTLTENRLGLAARVPYPPSGERDLIRLAAAACDPSTQDPFDIAILDAAARMGIAVPDPQRLAFVPFDPATKRSEGVLGPLRAVKGAPNVIADLCAARPEGMGRDVALLSAGGLRVLAVASGPEGNLAPVGILAFADPLRADSRPLLDQLRGLGLRVVMVTGDGPATAEAVGAQLAMKGPACDPDALRANPAAAAAQADIFAGVLPEDKFMLVEALQASGHVVGMTGDGVNDAPALGRADVGIAVSSATDVAKAAAALVLTNPGLKDVVAVIRTSRRVFQRLLTYSLNVTVKKLFTPLFLSLALVLWHVLAMTPQLFVLLMLANDLMSMSVTADRASASPRPDSWKIAPLMAAGAALAIPLALLSLGVLWYARFVLALPLPQVQTATFVWLVASSQAVVYLVRERGHFWRTRPSGAVFFATAADLVAVAALAARGWLMAAVPLGLIGALILLSALFLIGADSLKVAVMRGLA